MKKFFAWLKAMRRWWAWLLSCLPFRVSLYEFHVKQTPKFKHREYSGNMRQSNGNTPPKVLQRTRNTPPKILQRTGTRHK